MRGPKAEGTDAPNPAKNHDARNSPYCDGWVIQAAQMLQTKTKNVLQKMAELRPTAFESGRIRKGPTTIPPRVIDDLIEKVSMCKYTGSYPGP